MSDVTVTLSAKDEGLSKALGMAEGGVKKLTAAFGGIAVGAAIIGGVQAAFAAFKKTADFAGQISDLAAQTGMSAEATMIWGQALKNAGLGAESLGQLTNRLQKALTGVNEEGEPTSKVFAKLGLSIEALKAMTPDEQMQSIASAIGYISDPAQRAAIAMELFGKSGGKALALFTDSKALTVAEQQLGQLAKNLGNNIEDLDALSDAIGAAFDIKPMQAAAGFAEGFSGDMKSAADAINSIDFSKVAEGLGTMARGAAELVSNIGSSGVGKAVSDITFGPLNLAKNAGESFGDFLTEKGEDAKARDQIEAEQAAAFADSPLAASGTPGTLENTMGVLASQALPEVNDRLTESLDLMSGMEQAAANMPGLQDEFSASLDSTGEIVSDVGKTTLDIQDKYNDSLGTTLDQLDEAARLRNLMAEATEKEAKEQEKIAKTAAEQTKKNLEEGLASAENQLQQLSNRISTAAGANSLVNADPRSARAQGIGETASRQRAAQDAQAFQDRADELRAIGGDAANERADRFEEKAKSARRRLTGENTDPKQTLEQTVTKIKDKLTDIEKKLPQVALGV